MEKLARYLSPEESAALHQDIASQVGATEVAVVRNLDYVYAPFELYPLAPKVTEPLDRIAAFAVDMDGTSTTTEPLALHSLEYMVRRFTNRRTKAEWPGLDPVQDYPHVIGNSNFRHTEFLVHRYGEALKVTALRQAFFESLIWTLSAMTDLHRRKDIRMDAVNAGLAPLLEDPEFTEITQSGGVTADNAEEHAAPFLARYGHLFACPNDATMIAAALDIYYFRYHAILRLVEQGEGARLSRELLGEDGRHLVEPMPGYAVFLALIKGWLGEQAGSLAGELRKQLPTGSPALKEDVSRSKERLIQLGHRFADKPARIGLVTASIAYETHATIRAIFDVMQEQVGDWPLPDDQRRSIQDRLADYTTVYDGFVCATDASEARLKPHRDLYTIALYQMGIPKEDYRRCIGLEDTEPGIISLRASGVGCAVALPNHDTSGQNYQAAAHIVKGGLPELILARNLLLE